MQISGTYHNENVHGYSLKLTKCFPVLQKSPKPVFCLSYLCSLVSLVEAKRDGMHAKNSSCFGCEITVLSSLKSVKVLTSSEDSNNVPFWKTGYFAVLSVDQWTQHSYNLALYLLSSRGRCARRTQMRKSWCWPSVWKLNDYYLTTPHLPFFFCCCLVGFCMNIWYRMLDSLLFPRILDGRVKKRRKSFVLVPWTAPLATKCKNPYIFRLHEKIWCATLSCADE